jgi:hypothetical protein
VPPIITNGQPPATGSPEWWLLRLLRRLEQRQPELREWERYYEGKQPLAFASQKFYDAFGSRFPAFTSNFCSLVVEGGAERLTVQGFRFTDPAGDRDVWELWQENDLDAGSQLAHIEALIKGTAYALVEPQAGDVPIITVEDALDCIVESDPRNRRKRRAGLKRWVDDSGQLVVVVYLPEGVYKYRTQARWGPEYASWDWGQPQLEPGEFTESTLRLWSAAGFETYQAPGDESWPLPNPLEVVPLVELPNRPRLRKGGQSDIAPIMSNQDAVNKYRCDALIASEFAAFPQRYLLNFEPDTDPDTGRTVEPFRAAIDRLWVVPPPDPELGEGPAPSFGQFSAASLEPYQAMIGLEVGHISSISRLPYHYLLGTPQALPPSGESLKSSEAGLEHKTERARLFLGEGWEEVMRTALLARNDPRGRLRSAETIWQDSETRSEAVRTDAVVKLHAEGIIDDEAAWELLGFSPQAIGRLRTRLEQAPEEPEAPEPTTPPEELPPAPMGPQMST